MNESKYKPGDVLIWTGRNYADSTSVFYNTIALVLTDAIPGRQFEAYVLDPQSNVWFHFRYEEPQYYKLLSDYQKENKL